MLVDVGAGLVIIALEVAKVRLEMHLVIEDHPQVVERTKSVRFYHISSSPIKS